MFREGWWSVRRSSSTWNRPWVSAEVHTADSNALARSASPFRSAGGCRMADRVDGGWGERVRHGDHRTSRVADAVVAGRPSEV